jgi:uncharacterized protein YbaP (TraB family)
MLSESTVCLTHIRGAKQMHVNSGCRRIGLAVLTLIAGWLAAGTAFAEEGLFWKAEASGRPVLLLMPTIHVLPDAGADVNTVVAQAVQRANTVVIESPVTGMSAAEERSAIQQELYPDSDSLENHVGPSRLGDISDCAAKAHIPYDKFVRFKPYAMTLLVMARVSAPTAYIGLEGRVHFGAVVEHRRFTTLLSVNENIAFLASMPERLQLMELYNACEKLDKYVDNQTMKSLIAAWRKGDAQALAVAVNEPMLPDDPVELGQANDYLYLTGTKLFMDALMSERIQSMKGPILVALGAGHFSGNASILTRLTEAGYKVKRISLESLPLLPGGGNSN